MPPLDHDLMIPQIEVGSNSLQQENQKGNRTFNLLITMDMNRRYVFTLMLPGLPWPGQTNMSSWPPAFCIKSATHTHMCNVYNHQQLDYIGALPT